MPAQIIQVDNLKKVILAVEIRVVLGVGLELVAYKLGKE
jgi:hypothetical protein